MHLVAAVAGRDVVRDRQGIVDRDREADARRAHLEVAVDGGGGVHADHLPVGVDERPAGVARFDRRVDLNEAVQRLEAAAGIAPGGDGLVETGHTSRAGRRRSPLATRVADRDDGIVDRNIRRFAGRHGVETGNIADAQQRDVVHHVVPHDARGASPSCASEIHCDVGRADDDVIVGEDFTRRSDHHSRPGSATAAGQGCVDVHDCGVHGVSDARDVDVR